MECARDVLKTQVRDATRNRVRFFELSGSWNAPVGERRNCKASIH
jgi:hypothetical protein